ncbi:plasmid replication initiator RepA [Cronobacter turicensis]|nr:replication protein RepA [Klebsiella pneumoniae]
MNKNKPTQKQHWSELTLDQQIAFFDLPPEQRAALHESGDFSQLSLKHELNKSSLESSAPVKVDLRDRGTHSTKCLCPKPTWFRPDDFKKLPGEIGHAYSRLVMKNKQTGRLELRIHIANHPVFRQLREIAGRKRNFYAIRRDLLNHIFPLLVSSVDMATHLITLNLTQLAKELSTKDEHGNIIEQVTVTRVHRLIQELLRFGVLEAVEDGDLVPWDAFNRQRFPTHVALSERAWQMLGVDMDKLRRQRDERLEAEYAGIVAPGEIISVRAARKRWMEQLRHRTLVNRRERALKAKTKRKLRPKPFDERMFAMADHLARTMPRDELYSLSPKEFEQRCYTHLSQLDLALHQEPPEAPPPVH